MKLKKVKISLTAESEQKINEEFIELLKGLDEIQRKKFYKWLIEYCKETELHPTEKGR